MNCSCYCCTSYYCSFDEWNVVPLDYRLVQDHCHLGGMRAEEMVEEALSFRCYQLTLIQKHDSHCHFESSVLLHLLPKLEVEVHYDEIHVVYCHLSLMEVRHRGAVSSCLKSDLYRFHCDTWVVEVEEVVGEHPSYLVLF